MVLITLAPWLSTFDCPHTSLHAGRRAWDAASLYLPGGEGGQDLIVQEPQEGISITCFGILGIEQGAAPGCSPRRMSENSQRTTPETRGSDKREERQELRGGGKKARAAFPPPILLGLGYMTQHACSRGQRRQDAVRYGTAAISLFLR